MYHNLVLDQMFDTNPLLQTTNLFTGPGWYQALRDQWPDPGQSENYLSGM